MSHRPPEERRQQHPDDAERQHHQPGQHDEGQRPEEQSPDQVLSGDVRSVGHTSESSPAVTSPMRQAATRVIIEVAAGVIPNVPVPELTKVWSLTDDAWNNPKRGIDGDRRLADIVSASMTYAGGLMMSPAQVNWVRTEWTWL